jgi:hypothetical protein
MHVKMAGVELQGLQMVKPEKVPEKDQNII